MAILAVLVVFAACSPVRFDAEGNPDLDAPLVHGSVSKKVEYESFVGQGGFGPDESDDNSRRGRSDNTKPEDIVLC